MDPRSAGARSRPAGRGDRPRRGEDAGGRLDHPRHDQAVGAGPRPRLRRVAARGTARRRRQSQAGARHPARRQRALWEHHRDHPARLSRPAASSSSHCRVPAAAAEPDRGHQERRRHRLRAHGLRHRAGRRPGRLLRAVRRGQRRAGPARTGPPARDARRPGGPRQARRPRQGRDAGPHRRHPAPGGSQGVRPRHRGHDREPAAQERDLRQARPDLPAARAAGQQHLVLQRDGDGGGHQAAGAGGRACTSSTPSRS